MAKTSSRTAVSAHRERMKRRGLVRIELRVRKEDAGLLRNVGGALTDPRREAEARALLREHFGAPVATGLKDLLASAPLDLELDFERSRSPGRTLDL